MYAQLGTDKHPGELITYKRYLQKSTKNPIHCKLIDKPMIFSENGKNDLLLDIKITNMIKTFEKRSSTTNDLFLRFFI